MPTHRRNKPSPHSAPKRPSPKGSAAKRPTPAQLLSFFIQILPHRALYRLPALAELSFYERLFSPLVTLWYLLFQWLHFDHTLDAVLTDARAGGADALNPKLSRALRSDSTGPYSDARSRLPQAFLEQALRLQGANLAKQNATLWKDLEVRPLDGSTLRLRPHGDIPQHFPPHGNQHHKKTYWCLMRIVVSFCAWSGAALDCALGSTHLSEQALGVEILLRALGPGLFLGDRNFGIFQIVQAARQAHQQVLLRLTQTRARKLLGRALRRGDFPALWEPARRDCLRAGGDLEPVPGRLILERLQRPGFRPQWLCLFTTLTDVLKYPPKELVELYGRRWQVELNLRYIKDQMEADQLEVHSAAMARKEWLACLMAYNLIRAAMVCAALHEGICPLGLSFSACRRRLEAWLHNFGRTLAELTLTWERTLAQMAKCRLPKRRKPRPAEPRAKRHIRESFPPLVGSRIKARRQLGKQR